MKATLMNLQASDQAFMDEAHQESLDGYNEGGLPIGAVLVANGKIIGR